MSFTKAIPHVFELHGTKRFVKGDPLAEFLTCMRRQVVTGTRFAPHIWAAFEATFASDAVGSLDPRYTEDRFRNGFGIAMYWETLARWIPARAKRDDAIDRDEAMRLLNVPNIHRTGDMHGVFTSHRGMSVRLTKKFNATVGLVQEQTATIVDYVFEHTDLERYLQVPAGEIFCPRFLPQGIWLQVDNFTQGVLEKELLDLVAASPEDRRHELDPGFIGPLQNDEWWRARQESRARGMFLLPVMTDYFKFQSRGTHPVKRSGFAVTHAGFHTSTSVQGHTIRTGVTIDCGRIEPSGSQGMSDETWWFHLYVMLSRATRMKDMLLLRPPPRELLERGPPKAILQALHRFVDLEERSVAEATQLCRELGLSLPEEFSDGVVVNRRRVRGKVAAGERGRRSHPFIPSHPFAGRRAGYHFRLGPEGIEYYDDPSVQ